MPGLLKQPREMQQAEQMPVEEQSAPHPDQQPPATDPAVQQQPTPGQQPEQGAEGEDDPVLKTAIDFVKRALYENGSADSVHETMKRSQQPVEDMATLAYELTAVADEKTDGQVPDDLLMTLAATVLTEVSEIAEASGIQLQPSDIAQAFKMMTLRFVGEMGHDTRQLEQAFNEVSPEQINEIAAAEVGNV